MLPATCVVSSCSIMVICGCGSCLSARTHLLVGMVVVGKHISRSVWTSICPGQYISLASKFALAKSVDEWRLVLHVCNPLTLCLSWQNSWSLFKRTRSLGSPRKHKNNVILVFVDRFSKMSNLVAVPISMTASGYARIFINAIVRLDELPLNGFPSGLTFPGWFLALRVQTLITRPKMSTSD